MTARHHESRARGYRLAQIWTDYDWLSAPERKQLADFIALLKARPECFCRPLHPR